MTTTNEASTADLVEYIRAEIEDVEMTLRIAGERGVSESIRKTMENTLSAWRKSLATADYAGIQAPFKSLPIGSTFTVSQLSFRGKTFEKVTDTQAQLIGKGGTYDVNSTMPTTVVSAP